MKMNKIDPNQTEPADELDRLLNATLASYAKVNPRPGLDQRILANLRSGQPVAHAWWHWGLAAAVAAILVVLALSLRSGWLHPAVANDPVADHPRSDRQASNPRLPPPNPAPEVQPTSDDDSDVVRQPTPRPVLRTRALRQETGRPKSPKLDQFPSPQPLSAEEIALTEYVRNFPQDAQLIAAAQRQFDLETEKEMNETRSENRSSSSIQEER